MLAKGATAALCCVRLSNICILSTACLKISCFPYICFCLKIAGTLIKTRCVYVQQLVTVFNNLSDVYVFQLQMKRQPDASRQGSKRAGGSILLNRTISGTSSAGSGIPADYGAASSNPTPSSPPPTPTVSNGMVSTKTQTPLNTGDSAVPANRSFGDHTGMAGDALTPTNQEVLNQDATTHAQEDVAVPSTQSQESTPGPLTQSQENTSVPTTTTTTQDPTDAQANPITPTPNTDVASGERPQEIIEEIINEIIEEIIPVSNVRLEKNRLTVVIQQLLKMVETAANPAQATHFQLISLGVNTNQCLLPDDRAAELAVLSIEAFLISVDVFQQEGKFTAAIALMAKVSYASVGSQSAHA